MRDLGREDTARLPESVGEVERVGVVNYFDSQRFGFLKHGQGFIGQKLVRGDFEGALRSYLATPSELDRSDDAKVKRFWRDHWGEWNLRAPLEAGKKYAPILRVLRDDPKDFRGAFLHIDQRTRMMTLFELQSFVWNEGVKRYLSRRIPAAELLGLRYQAGALVFPRALQRELKDELWKKSFPLLAPDSTFADEAIKAAALQALRSQGLALEQLAVPDTRNLFFKHEERPIFVCRRGVATGVAAEARRCGGEGDLRGKAPLGPTWPGRAAAASARAPCGCCRRGGAIRRRRSRPGASARAARLPRAAEGDQRGAGETPRRSGRDCARQEVRAVSGRRSRLLSRRCAADSCRWSCLRRARSRRA